MAALRRPTQPSAAAAAAVGALVFVSFSSERVAALAVGRATAVATGRKAAESVNVTKPPAQADAWLQDRSGWLHHRELASSAAAHNSSAEESLTGDADLDSELWLGMDSETDAAQFSLLRANASGPTPRWAPKTRPMPLLRPEASWDHIEIMGLYNSGTNLLRALLYENFGFHVQVSGLQVPGQGPSKQCSFWKHSSLSILKVRSPRALQGCDGSVVGIAMVRNPLSWLNSMHREAYDLNGCIRYRPDWLTRRCRYPFKTPQVSLRNEEFENLGAIWAKWVHDYESLPSFGFRRSLVIRYEDLVMDTEGVMQRIASVAGFSLPRSGIRQVERAMHPSAEKGKAHMARQLAVDKIQSKSYQQLFVRENMLTTACAHLDRDTMRRHGYTDCDDLPRQ